MGQEQAGWDRSSSLRPAIAAALAKLEAAVAAGPGGARVEEVRKLGPVIADLLTRPPFAIVR